MNMHGYHLLTQPLPGPYHKIRKDSSRKEPAMPGEKWQVICPQEKMPCKEVRGGRRSSGASATPHLGEGGGAGSGQQAQSPGLMRTGWAAAATDQPRHPGERDCTPLLTLSALLIDVNGSVRSRRNLFLFCLVEIPSLKKIPQQQWAPWYRDASPHRP